MIHCEYYCLNTCEGKLRETELIFGALVTMFCLSAVIALFCYVMVSNKLNILEREQLGNNPDIDPSPKTENEEQKQEIKPSETTINE